METTLVPAAPLPHDENARINALYRAAILDTDADQTLESAVDAVVQFMGAPIAAISLVDESRQWFLVKRGLQVDETPRDYALCAYAILDTIPLAVADTREDDRFRDNPLVTGEPHAIAYAGAPIILDCGARIGSVCAIDNKPRNWTSNEIGKLQDIASLTGRRIDARRAELQRDPQRFMEFAMLGYSVDDEQAA